MRELADAERIGRFMRALGAEADRETRIYFTTWPGSNSVLIHGQTTNP